MIFDSTKNEAQYLNLHKDLKTAFGFIEKAVSENLPEGKYEIDGDNVYAMVQKYDSRPDREGLFEAHRKYIDVQYMISGKEEIDFAEISDAKISKQYSEENDVLFAICQNYGTALLHDGDFAVFFPNDAHRPGVGFKEISAPVRKIVVKLKV